MSRCNEFVVRGNRRALVAYLAGFEAGSGRKSAFVSAEDDGFKISTLRERLKHRGEVSHIMCAQAHGDRLRAAIEKAESRFEFEIVEEREIERASFSFGFETPSRKAAGRIKAALDGLPDGVRTADYAPSETTDPDARGAEVYTPSPEYVFRGEGKIEGDVMGVLATRRTLVDLEFMRCDEIDVYHAD